MPTPEEYMEWYKVSRNIVWRYKLDQLETETIKTAISSIEKAARDELENSSQLPPLWNSNRRDKLQNELRRMMGGLRRQAGDEIRDIAANVGTESLQWHSQTLSMQGLIDVNNVSISADQFREFFQDTPLGGKNLKKWVDSAFDYTVKRKLKQDFGSGILTGKRYPALVKRVEKHMQDFTRHEVVNLTRSYVQSANVAASDAVMQANSDIVDAWKWSAVLEQFNMETGTGTCLRCAALDGNKYPLGEGPACPLHVRCRCTEIPVTASWRELGIDADEIEDVARPWTVREDVPIGEGGRNIEEYGFHQGEYSEWFEGRGEDFKQTVLGPGRYELYDKGEFGFNDLVDPSSGKLKTIQDLT